MEWLRKRIVAAALATASVLIAVKLVVPGIFDFVFDLITLGLIYVVGRISKD